MTDATYRELERRHEGLLVSQCRRWQIPGEEFGDLMQEARIALWQAAQVHDAGRGASTASLAWHKIGWRLDNLCRDSGRQRPLPVVSVEELPEGEPWDVDPAPGPPEQLAARLTGDLLRSLAAPLEPWQQQLLRWVLSDWTLAEIAGRLGISKAEATARWRRTITDLKRTAAARGLRDESQAVYRPKRGRAVRCSTTGHVYASILAASREAHVCAKRLSDALRHGDGLVGPMRWEFVAGEAPGSWLLAPGKDKDPAPSPPGARSQEPGAGAQRP